MKLQNVFDIPECKVLVKGTPEREITKIFCCDLLSIAMGKAPADGIWVTVMGNKNTLAVASLTDTACIVLAEGITMDESALSKAEEEGIAVLSTDLPAFDIALKIHQTGRL